VAEQGTFNPCVVGSNPTRLARTDAILRGVTEAAEPTQDLVHYANGVVKMQGPRLDGEMHGDWLWNRLDGSLMRTGQFDRGKQIGIWRTYDRSGRLVKETDFTKRP
jgi:antitoxin component YwqK of YwqJK toxin-antitoxin module